MARRVYEYTDQEGNTFYSFNRLPMVNVGMRLTLRSRVGSHFQNFLAFMRSKALEDPNTPESPTD